MSAPSAAAAALRRRRGWGGGGLSTPPHPQCDTAAARTAECRPVYKIRDLRGEEVRGSWYPVEFQPIAQPTQYRIERILR